METTFEAHQLQLPTFASHHLPHNPPKNHQDCLAFQKISSRLLVWDQLHNRRTGEEYMYQNYYPESLIGPELVWAVYPRTFFYWIPTSGVDTGFPFKSLEPEHEAFHATEKPEPKPLSDSNFVDDYSRKPPQTHQSYLGSSQAITLSSLLLPVTQKPSAQGDIFHHQYKSDSQAIDNLSPSALSLPHLNLKRLHLVESSFDPVNNFKRQKIAPT